ncbi:MAG TPA: RDD family protein [Vicinamibacterales bacterium]|jgi:uncharacterized RDD family membrane protein YckC
MKCPKCGYIGFEPAERCRNCGYDFSLSSSNPPASDLSLRPDQAIGPLADFDLGEAKRPPRPTPATRTARRRQDPTLDPGIPSGEAVGPADLPLFGELDETPLVKPGSAPTPPLSVRRSTPVARTRPNPARLSDPQRDLGLLPEADLASHEPMANSSDAAAVEAGPHAAPGAERRLAASLLDVVLLVALDVAVLYFTLRMCRLATAELGILPVWPTLAFLLLMNGGYMVLLTAASGQTLGKMAFGLKVVSRDEGPVSIGQTLIRTLVGFLGLLPVGLGLLPAAFDHGCRGLHDRMANTRVIRAVAS